MDFEKQIAPFYWVEHDTSFSLCLSVGDYKPEIFAARADEGFEGGGYDWGSLAKVYLDEKLPALANDIHFDSEASMFCAYSSSEKALREFAQGFKAACEDEELVFDLFSRAELD